MGFARSPAGYRENVDLKNLVEESLASLRPQKLFKDLDIQINCREDNLSVTGDADQLRQVLINLLLNAAQALQGSGQLEVSLAKLSGCAVLYVDDSGPGIPESDREKVFQPFFSTKAHGEGTGLGLPLCRKLIDEQEGEISVDQSRLGGARLSVSLPLSE